MIAKSSMRYNPEDYYNLHEFDTLYFSGNYEHNLVCGVPIIDNKRIIEKQINKYLSGGSFSYSRVDGHPIYRDQISNILKLEGFSDRSFIATAGGTGGILLSMLSIIDSGDEIILIDPDFSAYRYLTTLLGAIPVYYQLEDDFRISPDKIERLLSSKTKAIIFSNPSNPLGTIVSKKALQELAEISTKKGIWIISDEVYSEFCYSNIFNSILTTYNDNVISIRSLSKSGGLGGWRIGYAVGSKDIISVMKDVQEYSFICPAVCSQYVAAGVLPETHNLTKDVLNSVKEACDLLEKNNVKFIRPEATFFICVIAPNNSGIKFAKQCYENGVAVLPSILFSKADNFVRLSLAGEKIKNLEAIKRFIEIYNKIVSKTMYS